MNKAKYYKYMFIVNGLGYILCAIIFAILAPTVEGFMKFWIIGSDKPTLATDTFGALFWLYSYLILVGMYGFMYVLVGLDITKNHLIISSGMIMKAAYFIIWLVFYLLGVCKWEFLVVGGIDLIFMVLFIEFFVNYGKLDPVDIMGAYPYKKDEK
ncbi:MAG: hypothetical protein FK730_12655 [Asgard group archaeon]|nr:hypothetical protein [Asgard group archaeon]